MVIYKLKVGLIGKFYIKAAFPNFDGVCYVFFVDSIKLEGA
jgi:hypothetical protein